VKNLGATIAQILLGYILIPIVAVLTGLFIQNGGFTDIATMIGAFLAEIPVLGNLADAAMTFAQNGINQERALEFVNRVMQLNELDMIAAASTGMWMGICFKFGKLIGLRGLPVLQALAGVIICSLLTKYVEAFADPMNLMLLLGFSVVLNIVLTIIVADKKGLALMLGIGCETVVGVFSSAYVALLLIAAQGFMAVGVFAALSFCLIIPAVLFMIIDYCFC